MGQRECIDCGVLFNADYHWKRRCLPCWKEWKGIDTKGADRTVLLDSPDAERAHRLELALQAERRIAKQLRGELASAHMEKVALSIKLKRLEKELEAKPKGPKGHEYDLKMVRRVLQVAHPDRHNGSTTSKIVTRFFQSELDRLKRE